jgi:endonuclease YncB( thermonuclease family)
LTLMIGWRDGGLAAAVAAHLALMVGNLGAAAQEKPVRAPLCGGEAIARGAAGRVVDGRTFALEDGREVRLAAVEVPPLAALPESRTGEAAPGGAAARDALAALLGGADIVLRRADAATDRYDRILAYTSTAREGVERSVQADLIAQGFARFGGRIATRECAAELLVRERAARKAKLGLWANSYYDLLDADNPADVLAERGRFALVEGKVVSVRESGATIYVNFGRQWNEDFTVTILKRNERSFVAAGVEPKRLAGRRVRVRGWIEERGGPWIEATRPEQIELIDRE